VASPIGVTDVPPAAPHAGRVLAAAIALPLVLVLLFVASLWEGAEPWLLLLTLAVWLLMVWCSPVGFATLRDRLGATIFGAVICVALVVIAGLVGVLLSDQRRGAEVASRMVQLALVCWALGLVFLLARSAVTRPWRLRSTIVFLVAPMLVCWGAALALSIRTQRFWGSWVAAFFVPLVVYAVILRFAQTHRIEAAYRWASPRHETVPPSALAPASGPEKHAQAMRRRQIALVASILTVAASGLLVLAALRVPLARTRVEQSEIARHEQAVPPTVTTPDGLARSFEPVLRLHPAEQWREASVRSVLGTPGTPGAARKDCEGGRCHLEIAPSRLDAIRHQGALPPTTTVIDSGRVYPLFLDVNDEARAVMKAAHEPLAAKTFHVLEYWLFYPYDKWTVPSAVGTIDQSHPSDWEFVAVGLGQDYAPVFVAYSEHCGGTWRPWSLALVTFVQRSPLEVGVVKGPRATHPLSFVAEGSHGNYPTSRQTQPDWLSCKARSTYLRHGVGLLTFTIDAQESLSGDGPIQVPQLASVAAARRLLAHDWYWGAPGSSTMSLGSLPLQSGEPPRSPDYQAPVEDPLGTIFGDPRWACDLSRAVCLGRKASPP
jgi:hypothetical protein